MNHWGRSWVLLGGLGLCGLGLAGCGGSGASGPDVSVGFESAGSSWGEGQSAQLSIVLTSRVGPLAEALQVTVRGSGNATAGADHDFVGEQVVTFAEGAVDGDAVVLDVGLLADSSVEGPNELLQLELEGPTLGGLGIPRHDLEIVDDDLALFTLLPPADVAEGGAGTVEVQLGLGSGVTLEVGIEVVLEDSGQGSATGGADYVALAPQTLQFAAGALDGARRSVVVQSLPDGTTEASETVVLTLSSASEGGQIAVQSVALTLVDDDATAAAFLLVDGFLSGGPVAQVANGSDFQLGSASIGVASPSVLELRFENAGGQPLLLQPLTVTGHVEDFDVELIPVGETAAFELPMLGAFPLAMETDDAIYGASMSLSGLEFAALKGATTATLFDVPLPGGTQVSLQLERLERPFATAGVVAVDGVRTTPGEVLADLSIWCGTALGMPGSEAFLSFASEGSHGWLRLGEGWGNLHLITERSSGAPVVRWMWETQLEANLNAPLQPSCAGELLAPDGPGALDMPAGLPQPDTAETTIGLGLPVCRLAIETDYQLFQKFGSAAGVTQYVTQLIAAVSEVYERDVQTRLEIVYLGVHTSANDGWSAQDAPGSNAGDVLTEFENAWRPGMPEPADLGHFISGAPLGGGVAYVGGLCSSAYGFGVSGSIDGNINWGSFSGQPSVSNWDFVVVAHELGHNFGSPHTHSYCPPVDQCTTNCTGPTGCEQGTLMSYCHLCGGMANLRLEFHPTVAERMREVITDSCLGDATLQAGAELSLRVTFEPHETAGARSADLELRHSASNEASPFVVGASGSSSN